MGRFSKNIHVHVQVHIHGDTYSGISFDFREKMSTNQKQNKTLEPSNQKPKGKDFL